MSSNDYERYLSILKKKNTGLYNAAIDTLNCDIDRSSIVFTTTATFTGSVLFMYVNWIIEDAKNKNIKRLYFLARDGYVLYEIARVICKNHNIDIECKYLYSSRIAWRLPQYYIQGKDCLDKIFLNGVDVTLRKIFQRAFLSQQEIEIIMKEIEVPLKKLDDILCSQDIQNYREKCSGCKIFFNYIYQHSKQAYGSTLAYFKQEGIFDSIEYALVDAGWMGSMQESFDMLINYNQDKSRLTQGYYFGMFGLPKGRGQDNYHTFYFNKSHGFKKKVYFNHNLFECLCCARDGMTIGYEKKDERYVPILSSTMNQNMNRWEVNTQINTIIEFAQNAVKYINQGDLNKLESNELILSLSKKFMIAPSVREAECYGVYNFSDDVSEKNLQPLAIKMTKNEMKQQQFLYLVACRMGFIRPKTIPKKSSWIEATIIRSDVKLKNWYRINVILYRMILYSIRDLR